MKLLKHTDFMLKSLTDTTGKPSTKRIIAYRAFIMLTIFCVIFIGYNFYTNTEFPSEILYIYLGIVCGGVGISVVEGLNKTLSNINSKSKDDEAKG